jgi:hypothetical protein
MVTVIRYTVGANMPWLWEKLTDVYYTMENDCPSKTFHYGCHRWDRRWLPSLNIWLCSRVFFVWFCIVLICIWIVVYSENSFDGLVWLMVFNTTFNNISAISWRSVLLLGETAVPGENRRSVASDWQTLSHNIVSSTPHHERNSTSQL